MPPFGVGFGNSDSETEVGDSGTFSTVSQVLQPAVDLANGAAEIYNSLAPIWAGSQAAANSANTTTPSPTHQGSVSNPTTATNQGVSTGTTIAISSGMLLVIGAVVLFMVTRK